MLLMSMPSFGPILARTAEWRDGISESE